MPGITWIPGNDPWDSWDDPWNRWDLEDIIDPLDNKDPDIADIPGKESQGWQGPNELPPITPETR